MSSRPIPRGLLAVLAVALAVRLLYFMQLVGFPLFSGPTADTLKYLGRAQEILAGSWLGEGIYFHSSPAYSYLLAAALGLGIASPVELSGVAWLQLLVSVAAAGLCWALGRHLAGPRAGLVAGLVYALAPGAVFYDGELLGDFLLPPVIVAAAWLGTSGPPTWRRLLGLGALVGFGALARPNFLVLLGPLALVCFVPRPVWAGRVAVLALGAALVVGPVSLRNRIVGEDTVMISSNGGVNLFIGNGPDATGAFRAPAYWGSGLEAYSTRAAEAAAGRSLKPSEVSAHWRREAVAWIRANPGGYLRLVGRRLRLLVGGYEVPNHMDLHFFQRHSAVLWLLPARWGLVLPLAGAGAVLSARRDRRWALPVLMLAFYLGSIVALFFVTGRYRFPAFPLFAALIGAGVAAWPASTLRRRGLAAAAAAVLAAGALWPPPDDVFVTEAYSYQHMASVHQLRGALPEAVAALEQALATGPTEEDTAYLYNNLGIAYARLGDLERARAASAEAMRLAPDNLETLQNRVLILLRSDQADEAAALLSSAPQSDPDVLRMVGQVQRQQGQLDAAVASLEAALSIRPSAAAWFQLALCHEGRGDLSAAVAAWEAGVRLDPGNAAARKRIAELSAAP